MATFSVTTTAGQDTAIQYKAAEYNKAGGTTLSPLEFARATIDRLFNGFVAEYREDTTVTKGEAYQKATPADQATIDAILAKYQ